MQVQLVVDYLARMQEWSPAATRTLHVVSRILNASKQISRDKSPISPAAADEVGEYSSQLNALENTRSNAAIPSTPKIPLDQVSLQQSMMKQGLSSIFDEHTMGFLTQTNILVGESLDSLGFQRFWDFLHSPNNGLLHDLPFASYQAVELNGRDESEFEVLWEQIDSGNCELDMMD